MDLHVPSANAPGALIPQGLPTVSDQAEAALLARFRRRIGEYARGHDVTIDAYFNDFDSADDAADDYEDPG